MQKLDLLYEGRTKRIFASENPDEIIIAFLDNTTAYRGLKKSFIPGKGAVNNRISNHLMRKIAGLGIPTHFIKEINDHETCVVKADIIPIAVVVRNIAAGSLAERLGLPEGMAFDKPIIEYYYKDASLGNPMINEYHITTLAWATEEELKTVADYSLRVNMFLSAYLIDLGIALIDLKLEFGKNKHGDILLADEISPDSCRLWDTKTHERLDKDRFRLDLDDVEDAYREILRRLLGN
ncbi:MAG: phosphoribosylaminoimidazolesuccinocarboxamide synthase [Clostridia bacterium]|nr:phosphoribosylaminoimidazolesuccinocarboxamide synthase [Clostridia bacterium]